MPMLSGVRIGGEMTGIDGALFSSEVKAATNALRQRIAGLVQAETFCRRYPAATGKRIDARQLCRIETGDVRVFVREMAGLKTDTAVQILVDRSASMSSSSSSGKSQSARPIEVARESCFATALALQQVADVVVSVGAFPGNGSDDLIVMARFQERIEQQAARFASLEADGGTPMAEAMLWGAAQLLSQRNPRRILMVITDGAYDEYGGKSMVARLAKAGIETVGIGIQCEVSHLFPRSRFIGVIGELPKAMFELLLEALKHKSVQ
jgi:cobaltochelatase CobT